VVGYGQGKGKEKRQERGGRGGRSDRRGEGGRGERGGKGEGRHGEGKGMREVSPPRSFLTVGTYGSKLFCLLCLTPLRDVAVYGASLVGSSDTQVKRVKLSAVNCPARPTLTPGTLNSDG